MSVTTEDRKKKAQDRKKSKEEAAKKFPFACFESSGIRIVLRPGEAFWMDVEVENAESMTRIHGKWSARSVTLTDIGDLSDLVLALTARLNKLIDETNEKTRNFSIHKVKPLSENDLSAAPV